ncbi:MAG: hypothetical protein WCK96_02715 [Methylococcales bacterium]
MNIVEEAELVDLAKNNAVKSLNIVQTESNTYKIIVCLTWKKGEFHLVTARKTPREWSSLDRLTRHINEKYIGKIPLVQLSLQSQKDLRS